MTEEELREKLIITLKNMEKQPWMTYPGKAQEIIELFQNMGYKPPEYVKRLEQEIEILLKRS